MSQGAFLLLVAWGIDRYHNGPLFRGRGWTFWSAQPVLWGVLALFLWQSVSLIWSADLAYGMRSLRIQLPLLAFPLVLITGRWDQSKGISIVKHALGSSVLTASIACLVMGYGQESAVKARDWSPFISHIRFSLMIVFVWGWWFMDWLFDRSPKNSLGLLALSVSGFYIIWKMASLTGVVLLPVAALVAVSQYGKFQIQSKRGVQNGQRWLWGLRLGGVAMLGLIAWFAVQLRPQFPNADLLAEKTKNGEPYEHHPDRCLKENGHHVWTYIAWGELYRVWNERSDLDFNGLDARNQDLKMTLIRFLSSKGLAKDAAGLAALTDAELRLIESGVPTVLELNHKGLLRRWDIIQFEIWNALDGGNPSGHSLVQRIAFLHAAQFIYRNHPILGVGVGDVPDAFADAYDEMQSPLLPDFRLRAHNQFFTYLIAGGPLLCILWITILGALIAIPRGRHPEYPQALATLFLTILALSCLTEDTLETQAGVTFAGYFLGLLGKRPFSDLFESKIDDKGNG